jgi:hypothetical protein
VSAPRIGVQISRRVTGLALLAVLYVVLFFLGNGFMSLIVHLFS